MHSGHHKPYNQLQYTSMYICIYACTHMQTHATHLHRCTHEQTHLRISSNVVNIAAHEMAQAMRHEHSSQTHLMAQAQEEVLTQRTWHTLSWSCHATHNRELLQLTQQQAQVSSTFQSSSSLQSLSTMVMSQAADTTGIWCTHMYTHAHMHIRTHM